MPHQTIEYRQPSAVTTISVTQTLGCAPGEESVHVTADVHAVAAYGAGSPTTVDLALFNGGGTQEVSFDLRDNGTLSGINAQGEGQGPAIAKAMAGVLSAVVLHDAANIATAPPESACGALRRVARSGDGKPAAVTVTYTLPFTLTDEGTLVPTNGSLPRNYQPLDAGKAFLLMPEDPGSSLGGNIKALLGAFVVGGSAVLTHNVAIVGAPMPCEEATPATGGFVSVPLRNTADASLSIEYKPVDGTAPSRWTKDVTVPTGDCYGVMVPVVRPFGSNQFELKLTEAGRISHIKYGAGGGASDAASALQSVAGARETDASRAQAAQDKADLIYEQHRLMTCSLDASACVK